LSLNLQRVFDGFDFRDSGVLKSKTEDDMNRVFTMQHQLTQTALLSQTKIGR
jgi:hypothetical protein